MVYKLTGVLLHAGTLNQGHYTAMCGLTNEEGIDIWYHLNDSNFHEINPKDALDKETAYMLFYTRVMTKVAE